jgi:hypothetical protein
MEATCSSQTYVDFQRTTRHYVPEDRIHNHRCENHKSYIILVVQRVLLNNLRIDNLVGVRLY